MSHAVAAAAHDAAVQKSKEQSLKANSFKVPPSPAPSKSADGRVPSMTILEKKQSKDAARRRLETLEKASSALEKRRVGLRNNQDQRAHASTDDDNDDLDLDVELAEEWETRNGVQQGVPR